uniref:Uncharacterized protein n=1 Tax=viral metagenome TaxID=1070528 RepID=A0A6C0JV03_9ZZZZ
MSTSTITFDAPSTNYEVYVNGVLTPVETGPNTFKVQRRGDKCEPVYPPSTYVRPKVDGFSVPNMSRVLENSRDRVGGVVENRAYVYLNRALNDLDPEALKEIVVPSRDVLILDTKLTVPLNQLKIDLDAIEELVMTGPFTGFAPTHPIFEGIELPNLVCLQLHQTARGDEHLVAKGVKRVVAYGFNYSAGLLRLLSQLNPRELNVENIWTPGPEASDIIQIREHLSTMFVEGPRLDEAIVTLSTCLRLDYTIDCRTLRVGHDSLCILGYVNPSTLRHLVIENEDPCSGDIVTVRGDSLNRFTRLKSLHVAWLTDSIDLPSLRKLSVGSTGGKGGKTSTTLFPHDGDHRLKEIHLYSLYDFKGLNPRGANVYFSGTVGETIAPEYYSLSYEYINSHTIGPDTALMEYRSPDPVFTLKKVSKAKSHKSMVRHPE